MTTGNNQIRLNKFLSQCGVASRRGADELIADGKVLVNGRPAEPGTKVDPQHDRVTLNGAPVEMRHEQLTIMLHKPVQVVTTLSDPEQRKTVFELLPERIRALRPVPVGRLDFFSEGLLLLTTDGELCNRLTHPRHHLVKRYEVTVREDVPENALATMRSGMRLREGERLAPVRVWSRRLQEGETLLQLELVQGVNRQIRRMCRDLGLTVLKLCRVGQGPLSLGSLQSGKWRQLSAQELDAVRRAVGLSKGPGAGTNAGQSERKSTETAVKTSAAKRGFGQRRS